MKKVRDELTGKYADESTLYKVQDPNKPWLYKYYTSESLYKDLVEFKDKTDHAAREILRYTRDKQLPYYYKIQMKKCSQSFGYEAIYVTLEKYGALISAAILKGSFDSDKKAINYLIRSIEDHVVSVCEKLESVSANKINMENLNIEDNSEDLNEMQRKKRKSKYDISKWLDDK